MSNRVLNDLYRKAGEERDAARVAQRDQLAKAMACYVGESDDPSAAALELVAMALGVYCA